ncbi:MAG: hypothetical protein BHW14_00285 [Coprococcus sp. 43_8]|nr:MAG: hypothetical protein BHW14_00285 [Coprococcus sp. 43_8]
MQKTDFNRDWTVQKDGSNEILHVNLPDDAMIREDRAALAQLSAVTAEAEKRTNDALFCRWQIYLH